MKLSVIIPARREPFLQRTIDSLLESSDLGGGLEIIAALDGPYMQEPEPHPLVKSVRIPRYLGMRAAINAGLSIAQGEYVAKTDAHCKFADGFDRNMVENCADDWLLIPRRYALDEMSWSIIEYRPCKDYHYLTFPGRPGEWTSPQAWPRRDRDEHEIDDTMTFQGSCWLANRKVYMERVGFQDDRPNTYGPFAAEQLEVGLKYWLGGHSVKVNKKTWYAHLHKMPRHYRPRFFDRKTSQWNSNWRWATNWWLNDKEPGMKHSFAWLIEKFHPPWWGENWQEVWKNANG